MRTAIISITENGEAISKKIREKLEGSDEFIKGKDFEKLKEVVGENFKRYDALIMICAVGIVIRMIAPYIENKLKDPAVIAIDEQGRHAISLLSGHIGGANELTEKVAQIIKAEAIITTATDINQKPAIDTIAAKMGLRPFPKEAIKVINSAILRGEKVYVKAGETILNLTPQRLILGIGCRRGTLKEEIEEAVIEACEKISQPIERINLIASVDIKKDEEGLIEFAKCINREIKFFDVDSLKRTIEKYKLKESKIVKEKIGIGNICESAALSCVEEGKFALTKTKFEKVTAALIWEK